MSQAASANDDALVAQVMDLESRRYDAIVLKDKAVLEDLLDESLLYTHSSAKVDTKQSFIDAIVPGNPSYEKFERDDVRVRVFHGVVAVVTGRAEITVTVNKERKVSVARYTNVWSRLGMADRRWRFVGWQATKV
jgi:hypothetical protein